MLRKSAANRFVCTFTLLCMLRFISSQAVFGEDVADEQHAMGIIINGTLIPQLTRDIILASGKPLQDRNSEAFWIRNRRVYQKRGIVIEDEDYIVRKRWFELDSRAVGTVTSVQQKDSGAVVSVLFSETSSWQERTFEREIESKTERQTSVTITRDGYDEHAIEYTYRVNGCKVSEKDCGVIRRREGESVYVDFPAELLRLDLPRLHDRVCRGPDWFDGYADGGNMPYGEQGADGESCYGTVVEERKRDGSIEILWERTGRRSSYRFDNQGGYYDIQKCP